MAALVIPTLPSRWMTRGNTVAAILIFVTCAAGLVGEVGASSRASSGADSAQHAMEMAMLGVNATVGMLSALFSPRYLGGRPSGFFRQGPRWYFLAFYLFWAMLLAIPSSENLGVAWTLIGTSTGVTAALVAYSGSRQALEAGWKYLILTTLGLVVALLGILIVYGATEHADESLSALDFTAIEHAAPAMNAPVAATALVLLTAGFAAKIGWAPVHHWLPDAHSQAPAPVSALLSAALLPTVVLVAWRTTVAMAPGLASPQGVLLLAFGLMSLAVAVPFLWSPLPIKRVLAYSSLEHMGVIAVGLGFGNSLALVGVLIHICGHALAKSLGFYSTIWLLEQHPGAATHPLRDAVRTNRGAAAVLGLSLGALAGLPPSPLFLSELLILAGGIAAGQYVVVAIVIALLALGFVGIARQGLDAMLAPGGGRSMHRSRTVSAEVSS